MTVPAQIRANLAAREIDGDDVLRTLQVPLLVTQGRADTICLPAMAEHVLATCPTAEPSWYDGVGHTPHLEDPDSFNGELAALTRRVSSQGRSSPGRLAGPHRRHHPALRPVVRVVQQS